MTTIGSYSDLTSTVIEYLGRDQDTTLIARIPTFVQFCEAKLNRLLMTRQMEQRSITVFNTSATEPQYIALPSDFQSMRSIKLTSTSPAVRLDYKSKAEIDEYRSSTGDVTNQPLFFTIFGNELEFCPTPDQNYTAEMIYRQNIPSLLSNSTNWVLTLAPDLYLYGTLLESAPYIKEDARIATWGAGFTAALANLNDLSETSTFNAGPLEMRISGVTP